MPQTMSRDEAEAFLAGLKKTHTVYCLDQASYTGKAHGSCDRKHLSVEEWQTLQTIIKEHELPCTLDDSQHWPMLHVYGHTDNPQIKPEPVLWLQGGQLPSVVAGGYHERRAESLTFLTGLVHTPRNKELLDWYKFRPFREDQPYRCR
jgi:hypothetical protein